MTFYTITINWLTQTGTNDVLYYHKTIFLTQSCTDGVLYYHNKPNLKH